MSRPYLEGPATFLKTQTSTCCCRKWDSANGRRTKEPLDEGERRE